MAFILSRFIPVIRAIVPLIAGIAKMNRLEFWKFNIISVSLWVLLITLIGYELGHLLFIKLYFGWIIMAVSVFSLSSITILGIHQQFGKEKL